MSAHVWWSYPCLFIDWLQLFHFVFSPNTDRTYIRTCKIGAHSRDDDWSLMAWLGFSLHHKHITSWLSSGQLDSQEARCARSGGDQQEPGGRHQLRDRGVQLRQQVVSPGEFRWSGGQIRWVQKFSGQVVSPGDELIVKLCLESRIFVSWHINRLIWSYNKFTFIEVW